MRNRASLLMLLIGIVIIFFVVFAFSKDNTDDLLIGEEKYLEFLWMVDGAFNSERFEGSHLVNGKNIQDDKKVFKCEYSKNNKNTCVSTNFNQEFYNLFASNIKYDMVYGDNLTYTWYEYKDNKYYFTNPINCNIDKRYLDYKLSLKKSNNDEKIYIVKYTNDNFNHEMIKEFKLIKEDNLWKISKATYYDLCGMEYNIE